MFTSLYQSIVLIDDDIDDQEIFIDALRTIAPSIQCYCDMEGETVLKKLSTNELPVPDLFFVDLNMPRVNGKEILKQLKSLDLVKSVPVIMYSTFFGDRDIKEFKDFGAQHYLIKSTSFDALCDELRSVLSKKW